MSLIPKPAEPVERSTSSSMASTSPRSIWVSEDIERYLPETDDGFGDTGNSAIASLASFNGSLYGGTLNQAEGCEVWRQAGAAFADGFESGDTSAWSATVP